MAHPPLKAMLCTCRIHIFSTEHHGLRNTTGADISTPMKTRANALFPQSSQSSRQIYKEYAEDVYQRSETAMRQKIPTLLFLTGYTNTKLTGKYALSPERTNTKHHARRFVSRGLVGDKGNVCLCGSPSEVNSELAGFAQQASF